MLGEDDGGVGVGGGGGGRRRSWWRRPTTVMVGEADDDRDLAARADDPVEDVAMADKCIHTQRARGGGIDGVEHGCFHRALDRGGGREGRRGCRCGVAGLARRGAAAGWRQGVSVTRSGEGGGIWGKVGEIGRARAGEISLVPALAISRVLPVSQVHFIGYTAYRFFI